MKNPRPVEVYWYDCYGDSSMKFSIEQLKKEPRKYVCLRKAIGYLVHHDKLYYYLAEDITVEFDCDDCSGGKKYQGITAIPKGTVMKKVYLK